MITKRPLDSRRLRGQPPRGFGWIDHRLLRQGYLARSNPPALALYCLLICASDDRGLSFYRDQSICEMLGLEGAEMRGARRDLLRLELIAYQPPIYQLLALPDEPPTALPERAPQSSHRPGRRQAESVGSPPALPPASAAPGLDLRAMVRAALQKGGAA